MLDTKQEIFSTVELASILFILLISVIIITAILYHNRKRSHKIDLSNFQSILLQAQLEVQEQTMQNIGADLHDNIGQLLSLTSLTLGSIVLEDAPIVQDKINAAIDLTGRSIKEMRQLGKLLHGQQLIGAGLIEAIRHEVNWVEKSGQYKVDCTLEEELPAIPSPDKDLIIFRILQESFNNIIKHSGASIITVKLDYLAKQLLQLYIHDNGVGFDTNAKADTRGGMGLNNIRRRAEIVGGQVTITSNVGEGTTVLIIIPYP